MEPSDRSVRTGSALDDVGSRDPTEGLKSEANTTLPQWAMQQRNGQHAQEPLFLRIAAIFMNGNDQGAAKDDSVSGCPPSAMDNAGVGKRQEPVEANADGVDVGNQAEESAREQRDACSVSQVPDASDKEPAVIETAAEEMDAEATPAKRRHEDVVAASQDQPADADTAWDAYSSADGRPGQAAGQELAIPVVLESALAQNEETSEGWLTWRVPRRAKTRAEKEVT
ncbi:hypothetical protein HPB52_022578 [Rhipicephalus sanguineus]|uniref:Uncharacterized protein n=1 Tax=Rhipicephalus sanguineus TaxID=34632 RepID=A0A9D4PGU1_RHISA|nr:hypothetical protein HPB52_022578 [Rhipicephalus sanguineus]